MRSAEVLAPAGSMETLAAALRAGADAVYVGGKKYSARSSAANFSMEELREAAGLCHRYGAKLDLAVNTVISDDEAPDFCEYIKDAASAGVDAFIVQDWGCAEIIRRCVPDAVLHASTQMSVHTAAGAKLLSSLGYARVVPARELDRQTIEKICAEDIETELFVHGALCMSVSGQCYMSAIMGSRSANRGCCGQACRLPFSASGNKNAAALSLKDLSLLPQARELEEMGVDSFKIEGRMKRPEYVASAVHELKSALNGQAPDMALLKGVFSRSGFTDGYFTGKRQDMFGVREKEDVTAARELIPKIHELYRFERKAYEIRFKARISADSPVEINACADGITLSVTGDIPEKALNRPTDAASLEKQLSKLGDTVFTFCGVEADIDDGLIVPAGKLNELRRQLCEKMTAAVTNKNTPVYSTSDWKPEIPRYAVSAKKPQVRVMCRTAGQLNAAAGTADMIIAPMELLTKDTTVIKDKDSIIISPPRFITDEEKLFSRLSELRSAGYTRLFCHTPDCIAAGRELGFKLHGSFTLNMTNSFSAERLAEIGLEDLVCSFELDLSHLNKLHSPVPVGAVVYGRLPLMLTRNCPIKNEVGCEKCRKQLTDRTGRALPVQCSKEYVEILNPDVLFMQDRLSEMTSPDFLLYILTDEDEQQTKAALSGRKTSEKITRGLYYRGI
ncbi:MAG TPA: DUF3656 domain-containing protein [Ruminococcus sp.]|nr:DUF3656 domain-containing protein [Ruminococcus sp.]